MEDEISNFEVLLSHPRAKRPKNFSYFFPPFFTNFMKMSPHQIFIILLKKKKKNRGNFIKKIAKKFCVENMGELQRNVLRKYLRSVIPNHTKGTLSQF